MLADGYVDELTYQIELDLPPEIKHHADRDNLRVSAYFTEEVRRRLFERLDSEVVLNEGLRIETTLDVDLQRAALEAIQKGLRDHDHRRGYRGPTREIDEADIQAELVKLAEINADDFLVTEIPVDLEFDLVQGSDVEPLDAGDPDVERAENVDLDPGSESDEHDSEPGEEDPSIVFLRELPFDEPVYGIVLEVDRKAETARIGFGEGVSGLARLEDVEWARKPNLKVPPRTVSKISSIFSVGDVAQFIRLPDPGDDGSEKESGATDEEGESLQASLPLARLELWQEPLAEGALLSIENSTGDVLAMIGGYDFGRSEFNRAVQAKRQPGSAFKPFIYGAALTRGYTPVSKVIDRPVVYTDPVSGFVWAPRNYGRKFYGPMTMRYALKKSINNATVHLFRDLGVRYVIDYARRMGIQAPLSHDLSLALGSSSLTLLELTRAYAIYPRGGTRVIPRFITRVTDQAGNELLGDIPLGDIPPPVLQPLLARGEAREETYPDSDIMPTMQIISPADAYLMSDLLRAVVQEGTGRRLRRLGRTLGGKTGTTNDFTDAWFMGFSPELTTGVWVGNDNNISLGWGESGAKAALPIWHDFMKVALAPYPRRDFEVPGKIEFLRIDRTSGLLAEGNSQDAYFQPFLEGTAPERSFTEQATSEKSAQAARDDIF
jgi:penicillin-binding protein 1A